MNHGIQIYESNGGWRGATSAVCFTSYDAFHSVVYIFRKIFFVYEIVSYSLGKCWKQLKSTIVRPSRVSFCVHFGVPNRSSWDFVDRKIQKTFSSNSLATDRRRPFTWNHPNPDRRTAGECTVLCRGLCGKGWNERRPRLYRWWDKKPK